MQMFPTRRRVTLQEANAGRDAIPLLEAYSSDSMKAEGLRRDVETATRSVNKAQEKLNNAISVYSSNSMKAERLRRGVETAMNKAQEKLNIAIASLNKCNQEHEVACQARDRSFQQLVTHGRITVNGVVEEEKVVHAVRKGFQGEIIAEDLEAAIRLNGGRVHFLF